MYIINQNDERWMDALRAIGKTIKPKQLVTFVKMANGNVDAEKTLANFFQQFGIDERIQEKFIEQKNIDVQLCGCIYKDKKALHYCNHHGPCCPALIP